MDIENNAVLMYLHSGHRKQCYRCTLLLAAGLKCTWILFKEKYLTSTLKKKIAAISPLRKVFSCFSWNNYEVKPKKNRYSMKTYLLLDLTEQALPL